MSTMGIIALKDPEICEKGKARYISVHWDGDTLANILWVYYNTTERVRELISLGDLSILGKILNPPAGAEHTVEHHVDDVTVAYGRDAGEDVVVHEDKPAEIKKLCTFVYIFDTTTSSWSAYRNGRNITNQFDVLLEDNTEDAIDTVATIADAIAEFGSSGSEDILPPQSSIGMIEIDSTATEQSLEELSTITFGENDIAITPPAISFDEDKLRKQVHALADHYASIVITEDNYKLAKKDATNINAVIKEIDARRKAIKKSLEAPLKEFDATVKGISDELQTVRSKIMSVTDDYDNRIRAERAKIAQTHIDEVLSGLETPLHSPYLEMVTLKDSYCNISKSGAAMRREIESDISVIANLQMRHDSIYQLVEKEINSATDIVTRPSVNEFDTQIQTILDNPSAMVTDIIPIVQSELETIRQREHAAAEKAKLDIQAQMQAIANAVPQPTPVDVNADPTNAATFANNVQNAFGLSQESTVSDNEATSTLKFALQFSVSAKDAMSFRTALNTLCDQFNASYNLVQ